MRLLLALLLSGCSALSSKEAAVGCQAADAVTTIAALERGAAELNPIVAGLIKSLGYPGLILAKAGVAWMLVSRREDSPTAVAAVNVLTCGAALNNLRLL